jgi:hypothetical protein
MNADQRQALADLMAILTRVVPEDDVEALANDLRSLADETVPVNDLAARWLLDARHD